MKKIYNILALVSLISTSLLSNADVTVYGRVTYNAVSDDTSDDIYFGRHEFAESNFGIKGSTTVEDITFGAQVEFGLNDGVSSLLHSSNNSRNRIQEFWVQNSAGKLRLGTGPSITWVISDVDQSGTWFSDPLGMSARFGATRRGPTGQSQTPFVQAQSIFNDRLRYDSPTFLQGATMHAQLGEDSSYELAFKYSAGAWRANAWYVDYGDADNDSDPQANIDTHHTAGFFGAENGVGVLAGYKHSSGINFTATMTKAEQLTGGDRDFIAAKLGYTQNKQAVSLSLGVYGSQDAMGVDGPDHERTTLAYHYSPAGPVKLWVQYTRGDTQQQEAFSALAVGGMVKF